MSGPLKRAQARYKRNYDKRVHKTPVFHKDDLVFLDKPPNMKDKVGSEHESITDKLSFKRLGPFKILDVYSHTATIDEEGIPNTVTIDRLSLAKAANSPPTSPPSPPTPVPSLNPAPDDQHQTEFVVDRIVDHRGKGGTRRYRVRWYGFSPSADTWEPDHHIPPQFIARYHARRRPPARARTRAHARV